MYPLTHLDHIPLLTRIPEFHVEMGLNCESQDLAHLVLPMSASTESLRWKIRLIQLLADGQSCHLLVHYLCSHVVSLNDVFACLQSVYDLFMPKVPFSFSSAPLVLSKAQELGKPQRLIWEKKKGGKRNAQKQLHPQNSHVYPNSSEPSGDSDFLG